MTKPNDKIDYLRRENEELRYRLSESEEAISAIRNGDVDAIIVSGDGGEKIFTIKSAETPYRILLDEMAEGAVIIKNDGTILYCNKRFTEIFSEPDENILGSSIFRFVTKNEKPGFMKLINNGLMGRATGKISYKNPNADSQLYLNLSLRSISPDLTGDICIVVSDITQMQQSQDKLHELFRERTLELEKANETLQEREERFRSILSNSQDVIYRMNLQTGQFEYISPACERLTGYTFQELQDFDSNSIINLMYPKHIPAVKGALARTESSGKAEVEYLFLTKQGEYRWVSNQISLTRDASGKPLYRDGNLRDITENKLAEDKLQNSEDRLRLALEAARLGIWDMDLITGVTIHSLRHDQIFGYEELQTEWTMETLERNILPDDISIVSNAYKHAMQTGEMFMEVRVRRPDRSIHWISVLGSAYYDSEGRPVRLFGVVSDITKRKSAENELREARDKLNIALENGNIGIWEWNLSTDEIIWDERLEKMFEIKPGTFGKTFEAFMNLINEEDISHVQKSIQQALENNTSVETIFRINSKNGKSKYISSKALVTKNNDGIPKNISGVCFDVTGLKLGTEKLISKLNEELLRSNKDLQSFAYVASHDLQEPLRMVSSFTQLLSMQYGDKLDDKAKEYIHFAVDGARRMYDLLNGLLDYSRIHTKGKEFTMVDANKVLKGALRNLSFSIEERKAKIQSDNLPIILADENQILMLFQNLISNGIKFSKDSPKIIISVKQKKNHYLFSIKDEGIGIEPDYFERIFMIFQRLLPKDQYDGTGIGLAIAKRIVERHDGKIWVESKPGKGSTFYFTIMIKNIPPGPLSA